MMADLAPAPVWLLIVAVACELHTAWPSFLPHPVRLLGGLLNRLEVPARRGANLRLSGMLCLATMLAVTGVACWLLLSIPRFAPFFGLLLAYAGLALGELLRSANQALSVLQEHEANGDLTEARAAIGRLVSRDTSAMDAPNLRRALAETLAENFNDAFVAPLFWLLLGGPIGLWLYKAVSTMDSMWGYQTKEWNDLGMAGARLDDVLAWLPARLSAVLLWLSSFGFAGLFGGVFSAWPGWAVIRKQAGMMASPNAGWPMAAAAWLHHARMGGPTAYFGVVYDKPHLGPWPQNTSQDPFGDLSQTEWDDARLTALMNHIHRAGLFGAILALVCSFLIR